MSRVIKEDLKGLLEPAVTALGYEMVDIEVHLGGPGVLRIFIDNDAGITLDDCAAVSRQISALLDVEDPLPGEYNLEVSSPGLDRRLAKPTDFDRFAGSVIKVKLHRLVQGRRRVKGLLLKREGDEVVVQDGEKTISIPIVEIETARLVPNLEKT